MEDKKDIVPSSSDSSGDKWLIVRASYDTRPVIERSSYYFNASVDDRPIIDRSSDDHRPTNVRCPPMAHRLPVAIFKFCKHVSVGHRPMIDRGPVAAQKLQRSPTDLSTFFSDSPTSQKSDVQTSYVDRKECD